MCFTASAGTVRRMPNGRLVHDRPRQHSNPPKPVTVTPVPANTTGSTITTAMTAKEETYSDPFAGLQMSPPASPPSSDGESHGDKEPVGQCRTIAKALN